MERVQKILARAGYGSRRACEELIARGRVRINNETAILGSKADPVQDKIFVDNQILQLPSSFTYIALYKPRGVISAVSSPNRKTVRDLIDLRGHFFPVGRLDFDSEGLILLTDDGDLTNKLTHPRYGHEKEYRVLVARHPDQAQLDTWRRGVVLSDGSRTAPAKVIYESAAGKGAWLRITLTEGRKRQIRECGSLLGLPIVRIIRTRIGTLRLGSLKSGQWRFLSSEEIANLKK